jgi:glycosyltransferase involved in cell wall biosynthesis
MVDHLRHRYHIIHALSPAPAGRIAVWLGGLLNIPVVVHLHSGEAVAYPEFQYGDLLEPKLKEIARRVCNRADSITVLSNFQKEIAMKNLALSKEPIVIPRGLDIREFPFKKESDKNVLRLLYIGYPERVKDPEGAVQVFQMISQRVTASLTIVGDRLNAEYFSALLTDEYRNGITFMGPLPFEELKKIYSSVDLLLVTSRYESQSAVALEAMACGVLVCGTHVGILADLSGKACTTVAPGDYTSMTEEILNLWGDVSRKKTLREAARHWVEEHDVNWTTLQYEDLMNKLVE